MALCVRSVSNKVILFNGVVSSRNNANKIPIRRSQFLEEFLSTRSSCSYQIAQKYKNEVFIDDSLLSKDKNPYVKEFISQLDKNTPSDSTWQLQTINSGKNKLTVRVKKYTPTQDDMILWSMNANILATTNNNLYSDLRLTNLSHLPLRWPDTYYNPLDEKIVLVGSSNPAMQQTASRLSSNSNVNCSAPSEGDQNWSSEERLKEIYEVLKIALPRLFVQGLDYSIYHRDIVLINNIRGTKTVGIPNYVKQVALLKLIGHLRFAFVKLEVLKMTYHIEDSTIRVRWRIVGVGGLKVMLMFWKYKLWDLQKMITRQSSWYDGFSTFYVGNDGVIHTHIIDKVTPDDSPVLNEKASLAAKLALLLGLVPRSAWSDTCAFLSSVTNVHKDPGLCKLAFPLTKMK